MALPKIEMTGRIIGEPQLHHTKNGKAVLKLRIVTSKNSFKDEVWTTKAECWLDVVCWDNAEELSGILRNKEMVYVTGELAQRTYEAKDGTNRTAFEVTARSITTPDRPIPANEIPVVAAPDVWATMPKVNISDVPF